MNVIIRVAGLIGSLAINEEMSVELKDDSTLEDLFKKADKGLSEKFFKAMKKMGKFPTVLIDGDRIDLPEGYTHKLKDGDEVSVLTPIAGG